MDEFEHTKKMHSTESRWRDYMWYPLGVRISLTTGPWLNPGYILDPLLLHRPTGDHTSCPSLKSSVISCSIS